MKLSLVVPCYNEEENIAAFQQAVIDAFRDCGYSYEIIFVDDGSSDKTLAQLEAAYHRQACPVSVISFSRNFGKEAGLYAGLEHATGAYVSLIDADLQQRPELVRQMVEILDTHPEYDIVAAYQDKRGRRKGAVLLQRRLLQPHQPSVHRKASSGRQRFPHLSPEGCRKHPVSAGIPPFFQGDLCLGGI